MNVTFIFSILRLVSSMSLILFIVFQRKNEFSSNFSRKDSLFSLKNKEPFFFLKWSLIFLFLVSHLICLLVN
jgi:hypothetical protein